MIFLIGIIYLVATVLLFYRREILTRIIRHHNYQVQIIVPHKEGEKHEKGIVNHLFWARPVDVAVYIKSLEKQYGKDYARGPISRLD
jgi:hypothetical protein